jgi:hypothetical protein
VGYMNRIRDRMWDACGIDSHDEILWEWKQPGDDPAPAWYRVLLAKNPDLSGPSDGSDCIDHASRAFVLKPSHAADWLRRNGFVPPDDLLGLIAIPDASPSTVASPSTNAEAAGQEPAGETTGDPYLSAKDLAQKFGLDPECTRKQLERWRSSAGSGFIEDEARSIRGPRYLYSMRAVRRTIDKMVERRDREKRTTEK